MRFEITAVRRFCAAHQLRLYDGSLEPVHGHNWKVKVTVGSELLDPIGVVMDFHELERWIDMIVTPMHNRHLNELAAFSTINPSAENVALHVGTSLAGSGFPTGVHLLSVEVWETDNDSAIYRPQN